MKCETVAVVFTESSCHVKCRKHHFFALTGRASSNCPFPQKGMGCPHHVAAARASQMQFHRCNAMFLLGFLGLPLASALAQLLLGFDRWGGGGGGGVVVVLLRAAQRGAEQQVADPGLDEGEGGAVGVPGGHHHLEEERERGLEKFRLRS